MRGMFLVLGLFLFLNPVFGLVMYVQPIRMTINTEVGKWSDVYDIQVKNVNPYDVNINIDVDSFVLFNLSDAQFADVKPNETREFSLSFFPNTAGRYEIPVNIEYVSSNFSAIIQSSITLEVTGNDIVTTTTLPRQYETNSYGNYILYSILVIIVVGLVLWLLKSGKDSKQQDMTEKK